MKRCTKCGEVKAETEFPKASTGKGGLSARCKTCQNAYINEWRRTQQPRLSARNKEIKATDPRRFRTYWLKNRFGITAEEYDAMFQAQGGVCAICKQPETRNLGKGIVNMGVDHDHRTGAVRGLLCHRCNTIMGMLEDDPTLLAKMIAYLEAWQA